MNREELTQFLRQSLADRNLSGSEKAALAQWLERNATDERTRGLARHAVFAVARDAIADPVGTEVIDWLEDVMKTLAPLNGPPATHPVGTPLTDRTRACFSPGEGCLKLITQRFDECHRSADVCVFTITDDRITGAILDAHRRGVKMRILSDHDKSGDLGSDMRQLRDAGIAVKLAEVVERSGARREGHMHHKFAIFDGERLLNGSYNWTRGAANVNFENLIDTTDAALVTTFAEEFKRLWNRF